MDSPSNQSLFWHLIEEMIRFLRTTAELSGDFFLTIDILDMMTLFDEILSHRKKKQFPVKGCVRLVWRNCDNVMLNFAGGESEGRMGSE